MSTKARKTKSQEELLAELAKLSDKASRTKFIRRHPRLLHAEVVEKLGDLVRERLRVDPRQALHLAEGALAISEAIGDDRARAHSLRAKANALWFLNQNQAAVELFDQCLALFQTLGLTTEVGRTLSTSIQPLILLGNYERALEAGKQAREIFAAAGDSLRLARLDINVANIFHRQNRFAEALQLYERAYQGLLPHNDAEGIGVVLHNLSVCLISLDDFSRALATYQKAREFCEQHGMPALVAQADYNIAYLYYLRGEYSRALERLRHTREACRNGVDAYHAALCDMDQSEIYLELNLSEEAAERAQEAFAQFQTLQMGYEAAKSLANFAIALGQQGKAFRALELFSQAKEMFAREKTSVWPSLLDLYQALVLYQEGRLFEARRLCSSALEYFRAAGLPTKEILCLLLLARLSFRTGSPKSARQHCDSALDRMTKLEAPHLNYQAHFLLGQIEEAAGNDGKAHDCYQAARQALETLRSILRGDELKIAFMKNKLEVYEGLVRLCLKRESSPSTAEEAFDYMEKAKSRSLRDLIFDRAHPIPHLEEGESELVRQVRDLREELNWYYHRIELEQLRQEDRSAERLEQLQAQARARENQFLHLLRELPSSEAEGAGLHSVSTSPLEAIRTALGPDTTLIEYFRIGEQIIAAVVTHESLEVIPLTLVSRVSKLLRMLQFQLSKFRLGAEYITGFQNYLLQATKAHLGELYQELLAPLHHRLQGHRLVFVPHEILHYLPLHALFDGQQYLTDSFIVSYAPSASIYTLCSERSVNATGPSLILGVPDPKAPFILEEIQSVAEILPGPEVFVGPSATQGVLQKRGPQCRLVHIATHGNFREDNPMFSGVLLGDSYLSLYDLYHLRLPVELVTLSGCSTGLNVIVGGDELLGLVRGLLYAGAQSLLLSLWDVHDRTTATFMKTFYRKFQEHPDKAAALQGAMRELREKQPHPFYWAPFILLGKAAEVKNII